MMCPICQELELEVEQKYDYNEYACQDHFVCHLRTRDQGVDFYYLRRYLSSGTMIFAYHSGGTGWDITVYNQDFTTFNTITEGKVLPKAKNILKLMDRYQKLLVFI